MPWVKLSDTRYENAELNQYTSYTPATETHLDFWYLHDGTSDKSLSGAASLAELGIPDEVIAQILIEGEDGIIDDDPTPGIGHNAGPDLPAATETNIPLAKDRLKSLVERIERLDEERQAIGSDIKDIFHEAKAAGFDTKVLRALLRLRKQEPAAIEEMETLLDLYRRALGM
jgi:uncharacterized protein (UPF0335 family)